MSLKSRIEALTTQISNAKTLLRSISKQRINKEPKKTSSSHNNEM